MSYSASEACNTTRKPAAITHGARRRSAGLISTLASLIVAFPVPAPAQEPVPASPPPYAHAPRQAPVPLTPAHPTKPGSPHPLGVPPLIIEPQVVLPPRGLPDGAPPPPPDVMAHLGTCLDAGIVLMVDCLRDRLSSVEIRRLESCIRSETIPHDRPDDVRACVKALGLP